MKMRSAVLGTTVLVVTLTAGAAQSLAGSNTVFSDDIVDGSITHQDVRVNSLGGSRLLNNAVTGGKLLDGSVTGADVDEGSLGTVPRAATTLNVLRAAVESDGTVVTAQSTPGTTSSLLTEDGTGNYLVVFPRNVSTCTFVGTITDPRLSGLTDSVTIRIARAGAKPTAVFVNTEQGSASVKLGFMLVVVC